MVGSEECAIRVSEVKQTENVDFRTGDTYFNYVYVGAYTCLGLKAICEIGSNDLEISRSDKFESR